MRKAFAEFFKEELASKENLYILLGDISVGLFLDRDGSLPSKVINMGIAEQGMINFAAGLADEGNTVVVHTISPFLLERAYEQIKLSCGYNKKKIILVAANGPYDYHKLGPSHHCPSDVTLMSCIENVSVYLPSTIRDLYCALKEVVENDGASYIRLTSRVSEIPVSSIAFINDDWRSIETTNLEDTRPSKQGIPARGCLYVCIGESLAYAVRLRLTEGDIWWTTRPNAILPLRASEYSRIIILEPYIGNFIVVPEEVKNYSKIERRSFSINMKRLIQPNMGWEDFE